MRTQRFSFEKRLLLVPHFSQAKSALQTRDPGAIPWGHVHATRPGPARRFCSAGRLFSMPSSPTIELIPLGVEPRRTSAPLLPHLGTNGDIRPMFAG